MTGSKWALTPPFTGIVARDVVAGVLASGSAQAVARAAVQEAAARGARVRFLHVVPVGTTVEDQQDADDSSFAAALRALREFPRVPVTFEVAEGDPGPVICERSTDAGILVVAADDPEEDAATAGELPRAAEVAAYCQRHADCDVLTVRCARAAHSGLASTG